MGRLWGLRKCCNRSKKEELRIKEKINGVNVYTLTRLFFGVPRVGFEPTRPFDQWSLSPSRIPVPPPGHI